MLFQSLLHDNPYHIDCLLQLSEVCKNGEDMQMAKELVGMFILSSFRFQIVILLASRNMLDICNS